MKDFGLIEPFDTDGLESASADLCFALGVEWELFRQRLKTAEPFVDLCLSANAERLSAMARRHGRFVEYGPCCEGWSRIFVGNYVV